METETQYQISPEDIEFLNEKYRLVFTYPAAAFAISAVILASTRFLSFPKFFRNPLESPEGNALFYTRLSKMAKPPLLLYGACVGGAIGLFQYELAKYNMFVKYRTLVNTYLDACEAVYVSELKKSQEK
ncbi:unnamed protein product [Paramecium primaurelia]|uniref:Uncharacterized protein n=2 Tax=Paramecium TaxID=5884 RepID=A0A8S1SG33_9CILI|nr:unnamed protein product [Paramecium primaurelia]CAD8137962.1 unnamed protein product [Paramecium pentaurelia]